MNLTFEKVYEKVRYPLFWFGIALNLAAVVFCSWCLVFAAGKFGFFSFPVLIDALCVGFNVWWLTKGVQRYRDMKQLDESIALLEQLLADITAEQSSRLQQEETSPTEETKELP